MRARSRPTGARRSLHRLTQSIVATNPRQPELHSRLMRGGVAIVAALTVLVTGSAAIAGGTGLLWNGSFTHGSGSWTGVQANAGGFTVVPAPGGRAGMAARFVVHPGDRPVGSTGERAEVFKTTGEQAGVESFWKWSVYFAPGGTSRPQHVVEPLHALASLRQLRTVPVLVRDPERQREGMAPLPHLGWRPGPSGAP